MSDAAVMDAPGSPASSPSLQQYTELAELAGGFIHDIKNHIGTLSLNLQLLAEDFENPETPRERRALDRVHRLHGECQKLVELSNDFLRFARVESKAIKTNGTYTIQYQDAQIDAQGCGGYAQARSYTVLEVTGNDYEKTTLYGQPFSIG